MTSKPRRRLQQRGSTDPSIPIRRLRYRRWRRPTCKKWAGDAGEGLYLQIAKFVGARENMYIKNTGASQSGKTTLDFGCCDHRKTTNPGPVNPRHGALQIVPKLSNSTMAFSRSKPLPSADRCFTHSSMSKIPDCLALIHLCFDSQRELKCTQLGKIFGGVQLAEPRNDCFRLSKTAISSTNYDNLHYGII